MDISNVQSFTDVAQWWLKFAKDILPQKIVLLVNKIDKEPSITLHNIYEFCIRN